MFLIYRMSHIFGDHLLHPNSADSENKLAISFCFVFNSHFSSRKFTEESLNLYIFILKCGSGKANLCWESHPKRRWFGVTNIHLNNEMLCFVFSAQSLARHFGFFHLYIDIYSASRKCVFILGNPNSDFNEEKTISPSAVHHFLVNIGLSLIVLLTWVQRMRV